MIGLTGAGQNYHLWTGFAIAVVNRKIADIRGVDLDVLLRNVMDSPLLRSHITVRQVAEHIFETRRITRQDQCLLMHLLCSGSLGEEEHVLVEKIYASLRKGFIRVVD